MNPHKKIILATEKLRQTRKEFEARIEAGDYLLSDFELEYLSILDDLIALMQKSTFGGGHWFKMFGEGQWSNRDAWKFPLRAIADKLVEESDDENDRPSNA